MKVVRFVRRCCVLSSALSLIVAAVTSAAEREHAATVAYVALVAATFAVVVERLGRRA